MKHKVSKIQEAFQKLAYAESYNSQYIPREYASIIRDHAQERVIEAEKTIMEYNNRRIEIEKAFMDFSPCKKCRQRNSVLMRNN